MKNKPYAVPRHVVVDTTTGEVVGVAKHSRVPVIVAVILALILVVGICIFVFGEEQQSQDAEPQQGQEHIASDFLREQALKQAQHIDELYGSDAYGGTDWLNRK